MTTLSNEKQLLSQLSEGDEHAFEKIFSFYSPKLYHKLLTIVKSEFYAQELLQTVFLKVWNNRTKIDPENFFCSYLSCIAVNCCYDFFRKANRDKKLRAQFIEFSRECSHAEDALINKQTTEILYNAIHSLPPKRRQIFVLCKFKGKSYHEVSQELGISTSTISDHIVKANQFIKTFCWNNDVKKENLRAE